MKACLEKRFRAPHLRGTGRRRGVRCSEHRGHDVAHETFKRRTSVIKATLRETGRKEGESGKHNVRSICAALGNKGVSGKWEQRGADRKLIINASDVLMQGT